MMRTASVLALVTLTLSATMAHGQDYVYAVERGAGQRSYAAEGMVIAIEAMRLYQPTSFEKVGSTLRMKSDFEALVSFGSKAEELWKKGDRCLVRYALNAQHVPPRPPVKRRMELRFTLDELESAGGAYKDSPLMYATRTAIERSKMSAGKAWLESVRFSRGRFTITVALAE